VAWKQRQGNERERTNLVQTVGVPSFLFGGEGGGAGLVDGLGFFFFFFFFFFFLIFNDFLKLN
jgi:hypothetical protein